jgi:hypothetical protein
MNKINQLQATKQAERKMLNSKMDWHMVKISMAHDVGNQHDVDRHDAAIRECELRLHELKRFV